MQTKPWDVQLGVWMPDERGANSALKFFKIAIIDEKGILRGCDTLVTLIAFQPEETRTL